MIEELKKEMLAKSQQAKTIDGELTALSFGYVYSILDKYKKKISRYEQMWNELKQLNIWLFFQGESRGDGKIVFLNDTMQELEQKYEVKGND